MLHTRARAHRCVISGFRGELDDTCVILSYYAASSGIFLPTFRDNLSFSSFGVKNPKDLLDPLALPIGCPKTSVRYYHYPLPNNPDKRSPQTNPLMYENRL
jgi:hypothetical protein